MTAPLLEIDDLHVTIPTDRGDLHALRGAGLREEDIIVSANRRPVNTIDDLRAAVRLNPKALLMNIKRGDGALFLVIR